MLNHKEINKIISNIGQKRWEHSLRVKNVAIKLGNIYGENLDKIEVAALLHDCAKMSDKEKLLKKLDEFDIILEGIMLHNMELIHGILGSKIAKYEFDIDDNDILNSIKYHTTGRENMSLLEKIIFIADYIEPNRYFPGVDSVRKLAYEDLEKSILLAIDQTIKFLIGNNSLIHINTIKARNYIKIEMIEKGGSR